MKPIQAQIDAIRTAQLGSDAEYREALHDAEKTLQALALFQINSVTVKDKIQDRKSTHMKTIQQDKIDTLIDHIRAGRSSARSDHYNQGKIAGLIHVKKIYESELLPVMEQMKEALASSLDALGEIDYSESSFHIACNKIYENSNKALEKYNTLFKKP